jgi:hypothetical protein
MPKNKVSDLITDQEMAFARLILSGAMTDRHAAEAVGLNPDSAAYTKSKPRVRAYMLEHRAAVQQQLVQQDTDLSRLSRPAAERAVEGLHRLNLDREQVLTRLWEIAKLSPEMTRGSVTGQVKALSMIVAMENFIPDRLAASSEKKSPPAPIHRGTTAPNFVIPPAPPVPPVPASRGASRGACPGSEADLSRLSRLAAERAVEGPAVVLNPQPTPAPAGAPPDPGPSRSTFANRFTPSEAPEPHVPLFASVPDLGVGFSIKNPFVHPR